MAKLIVEILNARDLLSTDGYGSASPFVEVEFAGHRQRTQTKIRDLSPTWNEKLVFHIPNPRNLDTSIIQVTLYDERSSTNDFLGYVQISGAGLESEAGAVQRYPFYRRGVFNHGRGDISFRIYMVRALYYGNFQQRCCLKSDKTTPRLEVISSNDRGGDDERLDQDTRTRHFYSTRTRKSIENGTANHLFVKVVKARGIMVCPYVEVKLRDHKLGVVRKHIVKTESLVMDGVYAFCDEERFEGSLVEVVVKDFGTNKCVGSVLLLDSIPTRIKGNSPFTPQWYKLENVEADKVRGEIKLGVWMGTQEANDEDDAFLGSVSDGIIAHQYFENTSSNVYSSPTLYYLRIRVIEARDLAPFYKNRLPEFQVRLQLGHYQMMETTTSKGNPVWKEAALFVASEPLSDHFLTISVVDIISTEKQELIGRTVVPLSRIPQRFDSTQPLQARWFSLNGIPSIGGGNNKEQGKILLELCLEAGYHVSYCRHGDFQPSAKHMKKDRIGTLQLAILDAQGLSPMKKHRDGGATTNAYCVAKYGNEWVRTRTIMNSREPCWNEQYAWEVYDPCTVITIGIFHDNNVNGSKKEAKDIKIGKVCIQLQTLELDRINTHYYPLLLLGPSGLKNHGRLQLAVQFIGVSWANMVAQYPKPLLPKMHYLQPIELEQGEKLRYMAMNTVAACLSKAEPPIQREIAEDMLDDNFHPWSIRKQKANFERLMSFVLGVTAVYRNFDGICHWRNPFKTIIIHALYVVFAWYPKLILPTFFLFLSMMGLWNYRFRPQNPPHLDARLSHAEAMDPDHLDEEFDSFPTCQQDAIVKKRYDRLRSISGRYQTVCGDIATLGEKAMAILTCTDIRATSIFTVMAFICIVFIYVVSFKVVATLFGLYWLRHPWFRSKKPSILVNLFNRLPSKMDVLLLT